MSSDSDYYDESDYKTIDAIKIRTIRKRNGNLSNYTQNNGKVAETAHKLKVIKFKLDEDPLQRRIYFLTFMESLEMIFSQYKETCEVLLDYPKTGGEDIRDYVKKTIRNLLHENIDVHSRRLIPEFPGDGVKMYFKTSITLCQFEFC